MEALRGRYFMMTTGSPLSEQRNGPWDLQHKSGVLSFRMFVSSMTVLVGKDDRGVVRVSIACFPRFPMVPQNLQSSFFVPSMMQ